jgi:hypothetical protein
MGARARGEQRQQQQQQCRALEVCRIPPGTIEMILQAEEEERLLQDALGECGAVVGVRGDYGFLKSASRPEDGGALPHLAHCFCLRGGWGGGGGRLDGGGGDGDGPPAPRMQEVGEAEFYMVDDDPPSSRGGGGGGSRLAARIVRPLPRGSVVFERAVAAGDAVTMVPIYNKILLFGIILLKCSFLSLSLSL